MDDYKIIKKYYGEAMAKFCRDKFPSILEREGLLPKILLDKFYPNHFLLKDILDEIEEDDFIEYVNEYGITKAELVETDKTAKELLAEAGYDLYECKTEEDIQKFAKYYAKGEKLCTFNGGRLNKCRVFFAVKKDIDSIKREDYENPSRQDLYGTSIISIQFSRSDKNYISIKNRYNHTVRNPDATFSNNLDKIILGLTKAFERDYNLKINQSYNSDLFLDDYIESIDGKLYRYNIEVDDIYYCPNNIIIEDGKVRQLDQSRYLLIDNYIIDFKLKKIETHRYEYDDEFPTSFGTITKIDVKNDKRTGLKSIKLYNNETLLGEIKVNKLNQIISLDNYMVEKINNQFMVFNKSLEIINLPKAISIRDEFLYYNTELHSLNLPNLIKIGNSFLYTNYALENVYLPKVRNIGDSFIEENEDIKTICLPNVKNIGDNFLYNNYRLKEISLPQLLHVGHHFLHNAISLTRVNLDNLKTAGNDFLSWGKKLTSISLPNLTKVEDGFLYNGRDLEELYLPNLEEIGDAFCYFNRTLTSIHLPKVRTIGYNFIHVNEYITNADLPLLKEVEGSFLNDNIKLTRLNAPNLEVCGEYFLSNNTELKEVSLPNLREIDRCFIFRNNKIQSIILPSLEKMGVGFLAGDIIITKMILPKLVEIQGIFPENKPFLKWFFAPNLTSVSDNTFVIMMEDTKGIYYIPKLKREAENEKTNSRKKRLL